MSEIKDYNMADRLAQPLVVEYRQCSQTGVAGSWQPLYDVIVEQVALNAGAVPNRAIIICPTLRWQQAPAEVYHGTNIRIRTDQPVRGNGEAYPGQNRAVLFEGFVTNFPSRFGGGSSSSTPSEYVKIVCQGYRWLMAATSPIFGIYARSRDDYANFSSDANRAAINNSATFFSGRRAVFNAAAKPNRDDTPLTIQNDPRFPGVDITVPIFAADSNVYGDSQPWTVRQMIDALLNPLYNRSFALFPICSSSQIDGASHTDLDRVVNSVVVDTANMVEAIVRCLKAVGFSLRETYDLTAGPAWTVYKSTGAAGDERSADQPNILHTLHAPAVDEKVTETVTESGSKHLLLFGAEFDDDIAAVINTPVGLGAPYQVEFTAELVPGWKDADLTPPDAAGSYANVYVEEADLQQSTDPNGFDFYKYYHASGASFKRNVGRKWVLNEAGDYSAASGGYDRGMPFDWASVLDKSEAYLSSGRRAYGLFRRTLLEPLTFDQDNLGSVGIKIEFSFDGGSTWHAQQLSITNLKRECGIWIENPNLSELLDPAAGTISGGSLDGRELNYWTSLCRDKLAGNDFKDGQWKTRVRVTASVQLDQRLYAEAVPTATGSPFAMRTCYDLSDKYTYQQRAASSIFAAAGDPCWNTNEYTRLVDHLDAIRDANQDASINGRFTLERLWLGDGEGTEDIRIGDGIEKTSGRNFSLAAALDGQTVYPEIIQITYDVPQQKQHLITRDPRLAEMRNS